MAISRSSAERLCSGPELELVEASYPANAKQLSPARLQQKIQRARRLRDKYRDLAKQQRGEARGKRQARSTRASRGNENTVRNAQLFAEVLDRLQKVRPAGGAAVNSGAKKAATKAGAKKAGAKKAGAKKAGAKKAGAKKAGAKKAGAKKAGAKKAGAKKAGAKKAGAKKAGGPAGGAAQPAGPGRPGAAAMKGARQRPTGPADTRQKSARAHNRASNQRSQRRRDGR
jgi:hypothetical protein